MELKVLATERSAGGIPTVFGREELVRDCSAGACPTVYAPDNGWLVVQGFQVEEGDCVPSGAVPEGEARIKISVELLLAAADKVRAHGAERRGDVLAGVGGGTGDDRSAWT